MLPTLPTFLYDADCGACSTFKRLVSFFDASHSVDFVPINEAARLGLLDRVPRTQWYSSSRMLSPDGTISGGGDALVALLASLPGGLLPSRAVMALPYGPRSARWLYDVVSRLHGGSCTQSSAPTTIPRHTTAWSLK
jgi:predicted DCC family thiol-disulfide oxidoreductase YuxK